MQSRRGTHALDARPHTRSTLEPIAYPLTGAACTNNAFYSTGKKKTSCFLYLGLSSSGSSIPRGNPLAIYEAWEQKQRSNYKQYLESIASVFLIPAWRSGSGNSATIQPQGFTCPHIVLGSVDVLEEQLRAREMTQFAKRNKPCRDSIKKKTDLSLASCDKVRYDG